jgi:hypothetical protein
VAGDALRVAAGLRCAANSQTAMTATVSRTGIVIANRVPIGLAPGDVRLSVKAPAGGGHRAGAVLTQRQGYHRAAHPKASLRA